MRLKCSKTIPKIHINKINNLNFNSKQRNKIKFSQYISLGCSLLCEVPLSFFYKIHFSSIARNTKRKEKNYSKSILTSWRRTPFPHLFTIISFSSSSISFSLTYLVLITKVEDNLLSWGRGYLSPYQ